MAIKNIMTPILGRDGDDAALDAASRVAANNGAHVDVVFVHRDPKRQIIPQIGEGASASMIESLAAAAETRVSEARDTAKASYDTHAALDTFKDSGASISWTEVIGETGDIVASRGRLSDLVCVVRGTDHDDPDRDAMIEAALMQTGRAALVVPPRGATTLGKHVAVAWNGSKEAARAVAMTMPLLETAESVTVIAGLSDFVTQEEIGGLVESLGWHGVQANSRTFMLQSGSIAGRLQAEAREAGADMLVMGAYSHSRLREIVFGGVTEDVLSAAHMPIVLAH